MNQRDQRKARARRARSSVRLETLEARQLLATFTVTSVTDSGAGSLRQAILDVNGASGTGTIAFDIPGSGVQTIALASPLPAVTSPAIIDATTQPGYAGTPLIELNGANILEQGVTPPTPQPDVDGLVLGGGSSTVRGLAIDRFTGNGLRLTRDGNTVAADFIGTDPTGTQALGNGGDGVLVFSRNNVIGGPVAADADVISGNGGPGVYLGSPSAQPAGNVVERDLIGTDVTGTLDLGNAASGVDVESSSNVVGGPVASLGNVIAFNGGAGVNVGSYSFVSNVVQDKVFANSIFGNVGLGIDLGNDGVTFNHPGGANSGPNLLQNFPVLTSAYPAAGGTTVEGTLNASPDSAYTVEFFEDAQPGSSGYGQGRTPIGSETFMTDATGNVDITSTLPAAVPAGEFVSATATDASGNTSEFARTIAVTATAQSDLALTAPGPSPTAQAGVAQTYVYEVQNNGPSRATGVQFVDTLPAGASFQSADTTGLVSVANGTVTVDLGNLASGAITTISLTYSVPMPGLVTNRASVRADQPDPVATNNAISQAFQVATAPPVDLSLYGLANPYPVQVGNALTFTFVITNASPNPSTGVVFTDPLPTGLTYQSSQSSQGTVSESDGTVTADLGDLPGGSNATVTVVVLPTTPGLLANFARVSGNEPDPDALNNSTTVDAFVNPAPTIDVATVIQSAPQPGMVGQPSSYAVLVGNAGSTTATGVTLTDVLPDAVSIASIRTGQGTYTLSGNVLTANFGSLAAGAVTEVTIMFTPGAPGTIVDRASVTADEPDFDIANNYATDTTTVLADTTAPAVVAQKLATSGKKITGVVLTFNKAIDPTSASEVANYQVLDLGSNGSLSASGPSVAIAHAVYNPVTRSVTLTFRGGGLSVGRFYKVVVNGPGAPGLVDPAGNVLDGARNGLQNSIYQSLIGRGTKSRPVPLQVGVTQPQAPHHVTAKSHHK